MQSVLKKKSLAVISALLILFVFLAYLVHSYYFRARRYEISALKLGTVVSIIIYAEGPIDLSSVKTRCMEKIEESEKVFSVHREDSEIARMNALAAKRSFPASEMMQEVIRRSRKMHLRTGGAFDPSVFSLLKLWHLSDFEEEDKKGFPHDKEISALMPLLGMDKVILEKEGSVRFANESVSLDFGGIAKGLIIDGLTDMLQREPHVFAGIVNIGGDLKTFILKEDYPSFQIGIRDPEKKEALLGGVEVRNSSVMTSGGYERFREYHKKKYIHILDPMTGRPVENGVLSVTVIGGNAADCDALATALMVLGPEKAKSAIRDEKVFFVVKRHEKTDKIFLNGFELRD
ncbi:MAG: FAD:protein FMN transferase [Candidatus Aureabacteria bacterium]|nr:FAD:protein FMN transferase [Candidatus Auribacterota bacterium]